MIFEPIADSGRNESNNRERFTVKPIKTNLFQFTLQ